MSRVEDIDRYLRAHFAAQRESASTPLETRVLPFVTISRQTGIGGHALADTMVEVFDRHEDVAVFGGWRIFDRSLCEIVARDPRYSGSLDSLIEEEYRSKTNDFFQQMLRSTADQSLVMNRVFRTGHRTGRCAYRQGDGGPWTHGARGSSRCPET